MCLPTEFKFCTCDPEQLKSLPDGELIWRLYRPTGVRRHILGKFVMPSPSLKKGELSSEWLEGQLNGGNRFDFDYKPQQGDQFMVHFQGGSGQYLSFLFQDGRWNRDRRMPFGDEKVAIEAGIVKH